MGRQQNSEGEIWNKVGKDKRQISLGNGSQNNRYSSQENFCKNKKFNENYASPSMVSSPVIKPKSEE